MLDHIVFITLNMYLQQLPLGSLCLGLIALLTALISVLTLAQTKIPQQRLDALPLNCVCTCIS